MPIQPQMPIMPQGPGMDKLADIPMPDTQGQPPVPNSPDELGMTSDERKAELQDLFDKVQTKENELNTRNILHKNNFQAFKEELFKRLFDFMKKAGVDPANLESINAFLDKLRKESPDLAEIFEVAFSDIAGDVGSEIQPPQTVEEGSGLMERYNNLAQDTMMPRE